MIHNLILSVRDTSGAVTEPVTVQQVKDWIRIEGFTEAGGAETAFTDDDTFITMIIKSVRQSFEKICGLTLTATRTKEVVLTNLSGMIELPYGPIGSVTAAVDEDAVDILADVTLIGNMWKYVKEPLLENMKLTYTCGYGTTGVDALPEDIKLDMLRACAYFYMHRGDEADVQRYISHLAYKHSRNVWLA